MGLVMGGRLYNNSIQDGVCGSELHHMEMLDTSVTLDLDLGLEAAEGRKSEWNGIKHMEPMCLMYLIPVYLFLSSHYHKHIVPN